MAGPGKGTGSPPPLFLDQTEAQMTKKSLGGDPSPHIPPTSPPPYLKVWIRHCIKLTLVNTTANIYVILIGATERSRFMVKKPDHVTVSDVNLNYTIHCST